MAGKLIIFSAPSGSGKKHHHQPPDAARAEPGLQHQRHQPPAAGQRARRGGIFLPLTRRVPAPHCRRRLPGIRRGVQGPLLRHAEGAGGETAGERTERGARRGRTRSMPHQGALRRPRPERLHPAPRRWPSCATGWSNAERTPRKSSTTASPVPNTNFRSPRNSTPSSSTTIWNKPKPKPKRGSRRSSTHKTLPT